MSGIQHMARVRHSAFFLYIILFNACQCEGSSTLAETLDGVEEQMFQQPENLDSLLAVIDTTSVTPHERARINTIRGLIQFQHEKFDKCIDDLEKAEIFFINQNDHYHGAINKLIRALVFERLRLFNNAADLYVECEAYFARHHLDKFKFYASLGLLRMSGQLALDREALFNRLGQEAAELKNPVYDGLLYAAMGTTEKNDSLKIRYYELAKTAFIHLKRWSAVYTAELNILFARIRRDPSGNTQIYYDHFPAKEYLYAPTPRQHVRYLYGQAYLLAKQGKDEKSIEVANRVLKEALALNATSEELDCIQLLSTLYENVDDYTNAYRMLKKYNATEEKRMEVMRRNQVLALGAHYRYAQLEREKQNLKVRHFFTMIAMGLLLAIVFLIIWILLKESRHQQRILKLKNAAIEDQFNNLLRSMEEQRYKNVDLIRQLEELKAKHLDTVTVSELLKAIDQNQVTAWMEYENLFQSLRPGWIEKLKQKVPELTPTELKYCMCLYFNLNNYSIASLCGVGGEAIKSVKKRIRDKLSLDRATDIYLFLKKFD